MADGCGLEVDVLKMLFCVVYRYTYVWPTGVGGKLTCLRCYFVLYTGTHTCGRRVWAGS